MVNYSKIFVNTYIIELKCLFILCQIPVYKMETGKKFPVYEMETGKISVLRNLNWKFYGLRFT